MDRRLELQALLEKLLGSRNVYFSPPSGYQMKYPCIEYHLSRVDTTRANNNPYFHSNCYEVTIIDRNPCSKIPGKIQNLPMCSFNRTFKVDNLTHTSYNLYY